MFAKEGLSVGVNEPLFTIEAMKKAAWSCLSVFLGQLQTPVKMETIVLAAMTGIVDTVHVNEDVMVEQDELLAAFYDADRV